MPAIYYESFVQKNFNVYADYAVFVNAKSVADVITGIERAFAPVYTGSPEPVLYPVVTTAAPTGPEVMIKYGYIFSMADGVASMVIGQNVRTELTDAVQLMLNCFKNKDASAAYSVIQQLSNDSKNIIAENVAVVRIKPEESGTLIPWTL